MSRGSANISGGAVPFLWSDAQDGSRLKPGAWTFFGFIVANAALFVRPGEIVPAVMGWPIYAVVATAALLLALPAVLMQFSFRSLAERPITACVIGVLLAIMMSQLMNFSVWGARTSGEEFFKVLLYYLLLLAAVDSVERLRRFMRWLAALAVVVTTIAVLQYHGVIDVPGLSEIAQGHADSETGQVSVLLRIVSTGIFNDPNDLSLLLILASGACVYSFGDRRWGAWRWIWLTPMAMFVYAMMLTESRGGFLGLMAAVAVFVWARMGWRRALPVAALIVPVMFFLFAGRQTEIGVGEDTAQARIELWSEGLTLLKRAPVFGVGYGQFVEEAGQVAHNSFVHAFAELGFFGGAMFLGAFVLAFRSIQRVSAEKKIDADLGRLGPYLLGIIAGYAVGMLSLSRTYVVPTYLVLGLAGAYVEIARRGGVEAGLPRVSARLGVRLAILSVLFVAGTYGFVRVFGRWG
jgi:O-antigen ligase